MKKNWFLTITDQVIDLNRAVRFFISGYNRNNWCVFAEFVDARTEMAMFDKLEDAQEYLRTIFNELCDEERSNEP